MKRMTTLKAHERRITTLETKVREVDSCHSDTVYKLQRDNIANRLGISVILKHLNLPPITEEQIDEVLDAE